MSWDCNKGAGDIKMKSGFEDELINPPLKVSARCDAMRYLPPAATHHSQAGTSRRLSARSRLSHHNQPDQTDCDQHLEGGFASDAIAASYLRAACHDLDCHDLDCLAWMSVRACRVLASVPDK